LLNYRFKNLPDPKLLINDQQNEQALTGNPKGKKLVQKWWQKLDE